MWWKILLVWFGGLAFLVLVALIRSSWRARKEYSRFLEFLQGKGIPTRASVEYEGETFIGGTVFCNNGQSFTFGQEDAFGKAVKSFHLGSEIVGC